MISCRTLSCSALVPEGQYYCDACGGLAQAKAEGLLDPKPKAEPNGQPKKKFVAERPKGQAVPHSQGLSQFCHPERLTPEEIEKREKAAANKDAKKATKEAACKALRLARGPKKQKDDKKNKKKGGNNDGKKGKPDKSARKNARHGVAPAPQPPAPIPPAPMKSA